MNRSVILREFPLHKSTSYLYRYLANVFYNKHFILIFFTFVSASLYFYSLVEFIIYNIILKYVRPTIYKPVTTINLSINLS